MIHFYHVSPAGRNATILEQGLVPEDAIFAWGSLEYAQAMAADVAEQSGGALIWEIDPDGSSWQTDDQYPDGWAFYTLETVPRERIRLAGAVSS